jgi:ubiquinone/menaquinone biosynthesis C-methylase UbiE
MEIGPGTGANLASLPEGCRWIGFEPNPYMHEPLRQTAEALGLAAEFRLAMADGIAMEDSSVDAVIATLVLCSVGDPARVLSEIRRVLRPGGRFYFIEHIAARRSTWLRTGQRLLRPAWMWIADGCRPDRETVAEIDAAGFASVTVDEFWAPREITPKFMARQVAGVAVKG